MRKKIACFNERVIQLEEEVASVTHARQLEAVAREVRPAAVALPEEDPVPAEMSTPEGRVHSLLADVVSPLSLAKKTHILRDLHSDIALCHYFFSFEKYAAFKAQHF